MCAKNESIIDNVVELYKLRICAALDGMSVADIRTLVEEIERKIANQLGDCPNE